MIWVSCYQQDKPVPARENLKASHSVVDVSPFELLSTMTGHELIFLEIYNSSSEGFELLRAVKNRFTSAKIVVVYHKLDADLALNVLRAGGEDVIGADANRQELDECFSRIHTHSISIDTSANFESREVAIRPALKIIDENISAPLREEDLANACQYSPTYFSRLFHSIMGVTLKQYIIKKRLDLACGLLRSDREKIATIANSTGFKDVSYFSRVFKKHIGCSPGEFRMRQNKLDA
ncbi:AraC family transcriptional regulator [Photobacterium jeanii]|uniref:AraC family transcriptional regulator n=1 Tax=Photobacterium jeanii TaxID=858640 RepID=A0A178KN56_9GAMM|nr:AraC family transcriptional regulator [Photobacterium jeanii]OAN18789.1 AraC family transcriptional regulator [Photobacterium jeanii]PST92807.1 DNA-binding response regulator [Photobacterium jeanii]